MGTRDHTVRVFSDLGPPGVLVHGVAVRPGKPVIIGATGKTLLFGLPGHPVSALTAFSLFVRPAIEAMLGRLGPLRSGQQTSPPEATVTARLSRNVSSAPGRQDHIRVRLITRTDGFRPASLAASVNPVAYCRFCINFGGDMQMILSESLYSTPSAIS